MNHKNRPGSVLVRALITVLSLAWLAAGISTATAATQSLSRSVTSGADDAEESAAGKMYITSTDLELAYDGSNQTIGIRFTNLGIPRGAIIERAYIQFNVDEVTTGATSLTIRGELPASGTAAAFTTTTRNISSRISTASPTVAWTPGAWSTVHLAGPDQATPDLTAIMQAVVNLANWQSGNAAAFIITGTGKRTAEAYEGGAAYAPILRVDYRLPGDVSLNSWLELGLSFNGLGLGVDSYSRRLLVPIGPGFQSPASFTATVQYQLGDQGYTLGFGGQPAIASGASHNFGSIEYGSTAPAQLYHDGTLVDTYTLVFTDVPVISLKAQTIVDEPKLPGTFALASGQFVTQNIATGPMGIEYRGQTSQQFEKKSFSIELQEGNPPVEREIKLLDLRKDGDWITDATYRDTTFVRNIVSMDIFRDMRPFAHYTEGTGKGQPAIRGHVAEVILNERYHGVYVLEEKVDRKLIGVAKISVPTDAAGVEYWDQVDWTNPANQSAIYKADGNYATMGTSYSLGGDWEQEYPDSDDVERWEPLVDLINWVNYSSNEEFIAQVGNLVDIDNVVDFWLMTNMTTNRDSLKKNYYIARSATAAGPGKWFFVPWDNDATFGMKWDGDPYPSATWWEPNKNKLISRLIALPATGFNARVKQRWSQLRTSLYTTDALTNRFIAYYAIIEPNGNGENMRTRNLERWPASGGVGADNPELATIAYLRDFIQRRITYLDSKIASLPQ